MAQRDGRDAVRPLASNRKARHDYEILERFEAGLELTGTEVKSARAGKVQLKDSHVEVRDGQAWLDRRARQPVLARQPRKPPAGARAPPAAPPPRDRPTVRAGADQGADHRAARDLSSRGTGSSSSWRWRAARRSTTSARPSAARSKSARCATRWRAGGERGGLVPMVARHRCGGDWKPDSDRDSCPHRGPTSQGRHARVRNTAGRGGGR